MTAVACSLVLFAACGQSPTLSTSPDAEGALVRRLIVALKDPDPEVRQNLAAALAKIGPASVEPLIGALKDPAAERRAGAAYTLALLGPAARSALPALLDILGDPQVEVRRNVSYAISRLVTPGRTVSRPATGTGGPLLSPPAGGK